MVHSEFQSHKNALVWLNDLENLRRLSLAPAGISGLPEQNFWEMT